MKKFPFAILVMLFIHCNDAVANNSGDSLKILFAGNSLTYTNDLPALVKELGEQDAVKISYHSYLFPNYSLEDHWNEGKVEDEIETGNYDYMVVQQGPSALPESQQLLLEYTRRFAEICSKYRAKLVLLMVWPSKSRLHDLDNVIFSYRQSAMKTGSMLCPAGLAWKYAWQASKAPSLYGADGFHPGMDGSLLAALTIYGRLAVKTSFEFVVFDKCSWKEEIGFSTFELLQRAAEKALQE